ncbi:hypothetical protein [Adhaeribacter radiodurans]|uniref:Uncharacterized protein n=1 Tax=Adhaeribacter radiodurans TaxID=2745197 RepID=A0A7L7L9K0_9BACT|nr:hypothetical protein [Adhaeribacter radiodurans]QMU29498.1 hypothetical protein HUW48_16275 [Adhaeribacter radiodurans]
MESLKLADTDSHSLEMNAALSLIYLILKKHIANGELRETILRTVEVAREHHLKHIMINSQQMDYVAMSDQLWLAKEFPRAVASLPDREMVPYRKIIGILPEESTRLVVGYSIIEKAQQFLKEYQQVEIVIFTSVNAALLTIEPS